MPLLAQRRVQAEKAAARAAGQQTPEDDDQEALPAIRLAQRAAPMQKMLQRCLAEEADLVWGV